jgi:hypothetical protein
LHEQLDHEELARSFIWAVRKRVGRSSARIYPPVEDLYDDWLITIVWTPGFARALFTQATNTRRGQLARRLLAIAEDVGIPADRVEVWDHRDPPGSGFLADVVHPTGRREDKESWRVRRAVVEHYRDERWRKRAERWRWLTAVFPWR